MCQNKRNYILIILMFVSIVFLIINCGGGLNTDVDSTNNSSLTIPLENDIQTLDPSQLSDPYTSRIVWQIYEGLVGLGKNEEPIPLLAESWKHSNNFREWTFQIRPNVFFHESEAFKSDNNTRSVTSQDVLYSYTRFAKGFGSFVFSGLVVGLDDYLSGDSDSIKGFDSPNNNTFKISLTRSDPTFLHRITSPYLCIMAKEVVEYYPDSFGSTIAIGTGPFKLKNRSDTQVILEKNPNYWRTDPGNLKRIIFKVDKNLQIRVAQFEKGFYGLMDIPVSVKSRFFEDSNLSKKWSSKFHTYMAHTFNIHYLGIDNKRVADVRLRRAIAMSIDKKSIVDGLLRGNAEIANELVPPGMQGFNAPTPINYNLSKAKAELEQSNYQGEKLLLLISDLPNQEVVGQLIQSQLRDIGLNIELKRVDLNTLISRLFSENRPDMFLAFSEWVFSAPELILESYCSTRYPNPNLTGYDNPQVDSLISRALIENDREKVNELCKKISALVSDDVPLVPLYHLVNTFLIQNKYSGFSVNGHQYWDLSSVFIN